MCVALKGNALFCITKGNVAVLLHHKDCIKPANSEVLDPTAVILDGNSMR
jgi:hypothetical protein